MTALVLVLFVLRYWFQGSKMRIMTAVLMLLATIPASARSPSPSSICTCMRQLRMTMARRHWRLCMRLLDYVDHVRDPCKAVAGHFYGLAEEATLS